MLKNCQLISKNIYTSGVVRVDWTSSGSAGWSDFLRVGSRVYFPFFFPLHWFCCQSQPASEPARLCPDLLCNCKNWREADSGGYRLWSLNVYFQPLFLIVRRSWVDVHICQWLLLCSCVNALFSVSWFNLLTVVSLSRSKVREGVRWTWKSWLIVNNVGMMPGQPLIPVLSFCFSFFFFSEGRVLTVHHKKILKRRKLELWEMLKESQQVPLSLFTVYIQKIKRIYNQGSGFPVVKVFWSLFVPCLCVLVFSNTLCLKHLWCLWSSDCWFSGLFLHIITKNIPERL